jgi:hypothetical protein
MKEVLNAMAQAMGDQAIALGGVADRVTALKQTLARQFPELADELKGQIAEDQEKSRTEVYELQVSLAKLREAVAQLPEPKAVPEPRTSEPKTLEPRTPEPKTLEPKTKVVRMHNAPKTSAQAAGRRHA